MALRWIPMFVFALALACQSYATEPLSTTMVFNKSLGPLKVAPGKFVSVAIDDQVTDGCWTNAEATRIAVQLELKRSGYQAEGKIPAGYIYLSAAGHKTSEDTCAVNIIFIVNTVVTDSHVVAGHQVTAIDNHIMWVRSILIVTSKANMSEKIKVGFVKMAQMFLTDIGRNRKLLLEDITKNAGDAAKTFWSTYKLP